MLRLNISDTLANNQFLIVSLDTLLLTACYKNTSFVPVSLAESMEKFQWWHSVKA